MRSGFASLAPFLPLERGAETEATEEEEGGGASAADASGTQHAQRSGSHSSRHHRNPTRGVREPLARCGASPGASLPLRRPRVCVRACVRARHRQRLPGFPSSPGSSRAAEKGAA